MKHKKQHWIPRSYLQAWCDPDTPKGQDKYVWLFPIDGSAPKKKSPENIFHESDMYTIYSEDGVRLLDLEYGLCGLEDAFAKIRKNVIAQRKTLQPRESLLFRAFIAAMQNRTHLQREHEKKQWGRVLEMGEKIKAAMQNATLEQRQSMAKLAPLSSEEPSFSMEDVKKLAEQPLQETLVIDIKTQTELFIPLHLAILCTESDPGFITSDAPCVWYDPEVLNRPFPYNSLGLMYRTIEITLPVSPSQMALLSWYPLNGYIDIAEEKVDIFNARTRFHAEKYFVARRNLSKFQN